MLMKFLINLRLFFIILSLLILIINFMIEYINIGKPVEIDEIKHKIGVSIPKKKP